MKTMESIVCLGSSNLHPHHTGQIETEIQFIWNRAVEINMPKYIIQIYTPSSYLRIATRFMYIKCDFNQYVSLICSQHRILNTLTVFHFQIQFRARGSERESERFPLSIQWKWDWTFETIHTSFQWTNRLLIRRAKACLSKCRRAGEREREKMKARERKEIFRRMDHNGDGEVDVLYEA